MRRRRKVSVVGVIVCLAVTLLTLVPFVVLNRREIAARLVDIGYLSRPLWEKEPWRPRTRPHFWHPTVPARDLCAIHGWSPRPQNETWKRPRVFDATLYSGEDDLLEIRLRELWDVVDVFVVLEANITFTGKPKPYRFPGTSDAGSRFAFAAKKIHYERARGLVELKEGQNPFDNEVRMRRAMSSVLRSQVGIRHGDLFITSDVDEVPRRSTVELFRECQGYPKKVHLEMRNYRYSLEFPLHDYNWKPTITVYGAEYNTFCRGCTSEYALADCGWHLSWCFRYLSEFRFKMKSYSHADRSERGRKLLSSSSIQKAVCTGVDVFGLLPEAWSFKELASAVGTQKPTISMVDVPSALVLYPDRFRFLLPGGCHREESPESSPKTPPTQYRN